MLIDTEFDSTRGADISSRIRKGNNGVGTCGSFGFCGGNVPIPCYTCHHFQPWLDGPHQIVLDELLKKRKYLIEGAKAHILIAKANDRTILAVSEVIRRCELRKQHLAEVQGGQTHD